MTIGGWAGFGVLCVCGMIFGYGVWGYCLAENKVHKVIAYVVTTAFIVWLYIGMRWYFSNTAAGQRALTDQKSNLQNGIERTINVYTADGQLIANYEGKIDIQDSDGGYVKFDFEGKRYIYYNCFIETIAEID